MCEGLQQQRRSPRVDTAGHASRARVKRPQGARVEGLDRGRIEPGLREVHSHVPGGLLGAHRLGQAHGDEVAEDLGERRGGQAIRGRHEAQGPLRRLGETHQLAGGVLGHHLDVVDQQHQAASLVAGVAGLGQQGARRVVARRRVQLLERPGTQGGRRQRGIGQMDRAQLGLEPASQQAQHQGLADARDTIEQRGARFVAHRPDQRLERGLGGRTRHVARRIGAGAEGVDEVAQGVRSGDAHVPSLRTSGGTAPATVSHLGGPERSAGVGDRQLGGDAVDGGPDALR
jgi:hypothetical protein